MLEELKRKDKIYDNKIEITHQIENYENLIFRELSRNLKGIGYEKAYNFYESLTKENLSFPLKSVQEEADPKASLATEYFGSLFIF